MFVSCLSWNSYIKAQLVSSDYEGIVTLWDATCGTPIMNFDEHEKRAWSVDFSEVDPTRLASGSDDTKGSLCAQDPLLHITIDAFDVFYSKDLGY